MRLIALVLMALLAGCAQQPPKDDSLYRDLGERAGLTKIVEGTLINAARDPRIAARYRNIDVIRLRDKLVEQFCVEAGGPCVYKGSDMAEVHKHMNINRSEFNALVEDLIAAMDAQGVAVAVQNRLIGRLAPMRGEVIER